MSRRELTAGRRSVAMLLVGLFALAVVLAGAGLQAGATTRARAGPGAAPSSAVARVELGVQVELSSAASPVGDKVFVTVVTTGCPGAEPTVVVTGANAGATVEREPDGRFSYAGTAAGEDVVTARVTTPSGATAEGTATHAWTPTVGLVAPTASAVIGSRVSLDHTVRGAEDVAVTVTVTAGPHAGTSLDVSGGTASYVGARTGTDTVVAAVTLDGRRYTSEPVSVVWEDYVVTLSVEPGGDTVEYGQRLTLRADVPGARGGRVVFHQEGGRGDEGGEIGSDDSPPYQTTVPVQDIGEVTFYAVYVHGTGSTTSNRRSVTRIPVIELHEVLQRSDLVGGRAFLQATTRPRVDALEFVVDGANPGRVSGGEDGDWYGSYDGRNAGVDTVVAVAAGARSNERSVSWREEIPEPEPEPEPPPQEPGPPVINKQAEVVRLASTTAPAAFVARAPAVALAAPTGPCGLLLELAPDGGSSDVGDSFAVTARVTESGRPVDGVPVQLVAERLLGDGDPVPLPAGETGDDGRATVAYTRQEAGVDAVRAEVVVGGVELGRSVAHTWVDGDQGLTVVLGPVGVSSPTGHQFRATAVVTDQDGEPVSGAEVDFEAVMPDRPTRSGSGDTDASGAASFSHTREVEGVEQIVATATHDDLEGSAAISHTWVTVEGLDFDLGPDGRRSPVGEPFTARAHVRLFGEPVVDEPLQMTAELEGAEPEDDAPRTDEDGVARFRWTRLMPGVDQLTASYVSSDGERVDRVLLHTWEAEETRPGDGLELEDTSVPPGADVGAAGAGCRADQEVVLTLAGEVTGETVADAGGHYEALVAVPTDAELGAYPVAATCGNVVSEARLDVVRPVAETATPMAAVVTASAVMVFFLLLGGQVLRFAGMGPPSSTG